MCGPRGLPGESDVLYRNEGNGTFTDVTREAGIADPGHYGFGVLFSDLDGDGWLDIFVANDSVPNLFFRNGRDGTFAEEALLVGLALSGDGRAQAGMGADIGDYNGDGRLDLVVTNFSDDYDTLYENSGDGFFTDVSHAVGLGIQTFPALSWGVGLVDFDNDGRLDLFAANGHVHPAADRSGQGTTYLQRDQVFRNLGTGRFEDVSASAGPGLTPERSSRGAAFGDYDDDGDIDVLVVRVARADYDHERQIIAAPGAVEIAGRAVELTGDDMEIDVDAQRVNIRHHVSMRVQPELMRGSAGGDTRF
jgi:hypothetical protein